MIELGRALLLVAVTGAGSAIGLGVAAVVVPRSRSGADRVLAGGARWALRVATAALVGSTAVLARAFAVGDHSVVAVADHSRDALGTLDRIMGLWGGMAGSLLLFTTLVAVAAVVGLGSRPHALATVVAGVVVGGLALTSRSLADPFATLQIPALDGGGLTPILEHWAMRIHPPLVYAGMAVTLVPAIRTLGAAAERRLDPRWWADLRPWLLAAWGLLASGMLLGSHWAHVELGWGGYWAWDPIENAALLPWLAATVVLHAPATARAGVRAPLAVLPLLLALVGAAMTRSGATTSVHAFAEATAIGRALAALTAAVAVLAAAIVVHGRGRPASPMRSGAPAAALAALGTVGVALVVVAVGTLYPLVRGWIGGDRLAIEGRWFSATVGPVAVLAMVALLGRGRRPPGRALAGVVACGAVLVLVGWREPLAVALGATAIPATVGALHRMATTRRGADLAHAGLALLLVGVAGTATGASTTAPVTPGETVVVAGHDVRLVEIRTEPGPTASATAVVAHLEIDGHARRAALVAFPDRRVLLAETTMRSTPAVDVQVILRGAADDRALLVVHVAPLQQLVWWGGLLLIVGGLWAGMHTAGSDRSRPVVRPRAARSLDGALASDDG